MSKARKTAVSGIFYPGNEEVVKEQVQTFLGEAPIYPVRPTAIIVPHSVFSYSGSVAASAYASLKRFKHELNHIVLLGSAHHNNVEGIAATAHTEFESAVGSVKTNTESFAKIEDISSVHINEMAHRDEHSIEVQLPFLQEVLEDFTITPLIVGKADAQDVAEVIERLSGDGTLVVVSTDLSQYQSYAVANAMDRETCLSIESLDVTEVDSYRACGHYAIKGLVEFSKKTNHVLKNIDYRNSGDTTGDKTRVIGYLSSYCVRRDSRWSVTSKEQREYLLVKAYNAIAKRLGAERKLLPAEPKFSSQVVDTFVTLRLNGELRGCAGTLDASTDVVSDIVSNSLAAAFHDARFTSLTAEEFKDVDITISVLSQLDDLEVKSEEELLNSSRVGVDGVTVTQGFKRGNFLPRVWEKYKDPQTFWNVLRSRIGLEDSWADDLTFKRYRTCSFSLKSYSADH